MRNILKLTFLSLFVSCQWFDTKAPDKDELLKERLDQIDWNEVSSYPSLAECDPILDKEQRKACFFDAMAKLIQEKLDTDTISILYPEHDTINVLVTVYPDSTLEFDPRFENDSVRYDTVAIDSLLKDKLTNFPAVEPAQKEGIPVKSKFILPVVLRVQQP